MWNRKLKLFYFIERQLKITLANAEQRHNIEVSKLDSCEKTAHGLSKFRPNSLRTKQCRAICGIDSLKTSLKVTWC